MPFSFFMRLFAVIALSVPLQIGICLGAEAGGKSGRTVAPLAQASDQVYPARPVRIIVPFPPGSSDTVARIVAQKFTERLGRQFIVDNRAGAAATMGTNIAAKAPADGYTILFQTCAFSVSAAIYKKLPYDSIKDLDPIARVCHSPMVLVAYPALPANSATELVALARAKPNSLNYGSNGSGSITSLSMEMLKSMAKVRITEITYKGAGQSVTALMAGEVQIMIAPVGATIQYVKAGRLKALAMASERRSTLLPDVPTIAETVLPGFDATCWYGMLVPHGTPQAIVNLLNEQTIAVLKGKDVLEQLAVLGYETAASTPKQFADYVKAEIARWSKVVKETGAQADL